MVNQSDVARLANVSFITVSRVINNKGNVKEVTRKRVLDAIEELGYHPSSLGRALNSNSINTIGMHLRGNLSNDFVHSLLTGIEAGCKQHNYSLLLHFGDESNTLQPYFERKVDGLIFFLTELTTEEIRLIEKNDIPCVLLWDQCESKVVSCLFSDDVKGGFLATEHLITLGHTRIAHTVGPTDNASARRRHQGYITAMQSHKLTVADDLLLPVPHFSQEAGRQVARELLQRHQLPSAVFCVSDLIAFGLMDALREAGIRVPEDISIIGYDNSHTTAHVYCPLTSVYNPVKEIGHAGAETLIQHIHNEPPTESNRIFDVELIVRKSTASP